MQQTETYQLNLIDKTDTFSPDPLNENAEKLDAALAAEVQARSGQTAGLAQRVAALEARKIVVGSYTGNGVASGQVISLGFTPRIIFVQERDTGAVIVTRNCSYLSGAISITENGFKAGISGNGVSGMNGSGGLYLYCAIS